MCISAENKVKFEDKFKNIYHFSKVISDDEFKEILRKNSSLSIQGQINILNEIENNIDKYFELLNWDNYPKYKNLEAVLELSWNNLLKSKDNKAGVLSGRQLASLAMNYNFKKSTKGVIDELIKELTEEYNTTTIINSHDMNSVMTIGEKIVYLRKGIKEWEGTKDILITSDNNYLIDFVYSSELFKELREYLIKINKTSIDNIITTVENETDQENNEMIVHQNQSILSFLDCCLRCTPVSRDYKTQTKGSNEESDAA